MKLNIQMFGGRGASSGPRMERLNIVANNENVRIKFNQIKKGDTFKIDAGDGDVYNLKVGNKMTNGYYVEGTKEKAGGTFISTLVTDRTYENASDTSKLYMVPLSKTRNWRR